MSQSLRNHIKKNYVVEVATQIKAMHKKTKANEVGEEARETTSRIIKDSRKTSLTAIFAESQPAKPVETAKNSGVNRRCGKFVS